MIKKIARDVLDKLNATQLEDYEDMVGLEAHVREMESLLDLDNVGVKIVAISGPAGIGKTTIARALHGLLSNRFQLSRFVDNLRGSYHSGFDEYGLKLHLQERFLSKVLNQSGMRICHLGAIKEYLSDQRVLIILDDVNNLKQLEALANETTWFGLGSRIVVTTENKELLQQHGINNTYHVGFPSREEALKILCRYAFKKNSLYHGFEKLALRVTKLCGNLPLGLRVVGSSLCGKNDDEWEDVIRRLETILDRGIEDVLRVGYESLDENEQTLFLHIAVFFNNICGDLMKTMFVDSDLDVKYGLKILENRSLIERSTYGDQIVMHRLLQQVGKKAIHRQEPWKRQILIDVHKICEVLEDAKGTRVVSGISFDISNIDEVSINKKAFKRMPNLRFLRVYKSRYDGNYKMHIPEEIEFPRRLRLLDWEAYSSKFLPPTFNLECLVKLNMRASQLEKLWEGIQPLKNLKYMDLSWSKNLKELPDLSNATNLVKLELNCCESLVEIPSSFSHLHKLKWLEMGYCINLQVIPAHMNLASLEYVYMNGCKRLRNIPLLSTNVRQKINLSADNCESLETVFFPLSNPHGNIFITNCIKLSQQARRGIIRRSFCYQEAGRIPTLPGREVPAEFDNRARGSSLTIVLDGNSSYTGFVFCVVISPNQRISAYWFSEISWRRIIAQDDGYPVKGFALVGTTYSKCQTEHLCIFHYRFREFYRPEVNREMIFEFSSASQDFEIIECGAKILTQEESIEWRSDQASEDDIEFDPSEEAFEDNTEYGDPTNITDGEKQTDCWSWLFLCFGLSDFFRGRRRKKEGRS